MEPTQGLEQSLLLLAPAPGTIREGARRATARNCCCYTSSTTAHAKTKRAPRTEEGYRPGWAFSISFFAICEVEMEGAIRVGEHRLRHQGQGQPGRTRRSSRLAAERRGRLMYRRGEVGETAVLLLSCTGFTGLGSSLQGLGCIVRGVGRCQPLCRVSSLDQGGQVPLVGGMLSM